MSGWDLVVSRRDLRQAELAPMDTDAPLADGEVLLEVESFALTANNITYGAAGEQLGYWRFFPAPEGKGRLPVWGFARVVRSNTPDAPVGLRLFGYWPMSSHVVSRLEKRPSGYAEVSAHRADLPPTYNSYRLAQPAEGDNWQALLWPLLMTSFLLDDQLSETPLKALVLSSASSKTAMGLAWMARRRGLNVTGLTSSNQVERLRGFGLYDEVSGYDAIDKLSPSGPAAYVDFAGRAAITQGVHDTWGEKLIASIIVGVTHWDALGGPPPTGGPAPAFFFVPDRIRQRLQDWGPADLDARFAAMLQGFIRENAWLKIQTHVGPEALKALYNDVVVGRMRPDEGYIVRPR